MFQRGFKPVNHNPPDVAMFTGIMESRGPN